MIAKLVKRVQILLAYPLYKRQKARSRSRQPITKDAFTETVAQSAAGKSAAGLIWDRLRALTYYDSFTPHPDDDLYRIFGLAEEDLDEDLILSAIQTMRVPVPDWQALKAFGQIKTPRDIVRLIERQSLAP